MNQLKLWVPAVSMMLVSLISYIDRVTLSTLAPTICKQTDISDEEYGWVIAAFSIAYMIGNPVWGWVLDRYGLRVGMTAAVLFWTAASTAHAFATGAWTFAVARALLGFGEGATFPGGLRAVMQTLPPHKRARGVAIAYSGGSLGAMVGPLIVTPINTHWGWQTAFLFTGLIGCTWVVLWQFVAMMPEVRGTKTSVSQEGNIGQRDSTGPLSANASKSNTNRPRMSDQPVWAFMCSYALGGAPLAFLTYFTSLYLSRAFSLPQTTIGLVLWIPPLGWEVGYFFWGWISDRMHRKSESAINVQRKLMLILAALSLPLAAVPLCPSFPGVMAFKFVAMAVAAGFIIVAVSYATHIYSTSNSGLIAGLGAGAWAAGSFVVMPIYGYLFQHQLYWMAFVLAAILPVAGMLLWLKLSPVPLLAPVKGTS